MADNEQLEQTLTRMLRVLVHRPDNVTFKDRLHSAGVDITQVFVRIDPDENRMERLSREIQQRERLIELMRIASHYAKWDDFVSILSRIALFDGAESTVFDGLPTSASRLL